MQRSVGSSFLSFVVGVILLGSFATGLLVLYNAGWLRPPQRSTPAPTFNAQPTYVVEPRPQLAMPQLPVRAAPATQAQDAQPAPAAPAIQPQPAAVPDAPQVERQVISIQQVPADAPDAVPVEVRRVVITLPNDADRETIVSDGGTKRKGGRP